MYETKYNVTFELGRGDYCIVRPRYHKWINVVTYDRGMHELVWRPHTSSPRRACEPRFIYSCGHWPKYWHAPCILRAATEPCGFIILWIINTQYDCLFPYCGIHYKLFYIGQKTALSQSECLIFMLFVPKRGGPTKLACLTCHDLCAQGLFSCILEQFY